MAIITPAAGVSHPDVADATFQGVFYRCYVMRNDNTGQIEAALYIEQDGGQDVLVKTWQIRGFYTDQEDIAKIIASGSTFIIVVEHTNTTPQTDLHIYTLSLAAIGSGWTSQGSQQVHEDGLWDITPNDRGLSNDWFAAFKRITDGFVVVARFNGFTWGSSVWVTNTGAVADTSGSDGNGCLGIYASVDDDVVMVAYQRDATNLLRINRFDADGTNPANDETAAVTSRDARAVGICRYSDTQCVVLATWDGASAWLVSTEGYIVDMADASVAVEHMELQNVSLQSRPWDWPSDKRDGSAHDVYCVVGFQSSTDPGSWDQNSLFCVALDVEKWNTAGTWRARPVCNMNLGTADSRRPGREGRQKNHVSHVSACNTNGPHRKTRLTAHATYARKTVGPASAANRIFDTELYPTNQQVRGYRFHMEDPWAASRGLPDASSDLSAAFRFPYAEGHYQHAEIGDHLVIAGGTPSVYDGKCVTEIGFCWYPEIISVTNGGAGSNILAGDHWYTAVYEWRDTLGRLHRSAPARPKLHNLPTDQNFLVVKVRSVSLTMKEHPGNPGGGRISIVLYRTAVDPTSAGTTLFYRVGSYDETDDTGTNQPTENSVDIIDNQLDDAPGPPVTVNLTGNELCPYTLQPGGAWSPLPNLQPPATSIVAAWNNRVVMPASETPEVIWYSKEYIPEQGGAHPPAPEFSPTLTYRLNEGRQVTGLATMDNALTILKRDMVFVLTGIPANNAGGGADLLHQRVSTGTGCMDPRSIAVYPLGAFFQSEKGYYHFTRTFELQYLGQGAEDLFRLAGNVRSAHVLEDRHQLRCVVEKIGGRSSLCYDYLQRQWSEFTHAALESDTEAAQHVSGALYRGVSTDQQHVILTRNGMGIEWPAGHGSQYFDQQYDGTFVPVLARIKTGWVRLAGIAGLKRVWRVVVPASVDEDSHWLVTMEYAINQDYATPLTQVREWTQAPDAFVIKPRHQKMQAFRVQFAEQSDTVAGNVVFRAIGLKVGVRRGHGRSASVNHGEAV